MSCASGLEPLRFPKEHFQHWISGRIFWVSLDGVTYIARSSHDMFVLCSRGPGNRLKNEVAYGIVQEGLFVTCRNSHSVLQVFMTKYVPEQCRGSVLDEHGCPMSRSCKQQTRLITYSDVGHCFRKCSMRTWMFRICIAAWMVLDICKWREYMFAD